MFLNSEVKRAFTKLRQAIVEASILNDFHLQCHIRFETDTSDYMTGEIFSQIILDDLGQ